MRLHRVKIENFRGIVLRELRFDDGVVSVIQGPNEIGKSTIVEALDLLLTYKADSRSGDVRQVKPVNRDVGSLVEADIESGKYRFVYTKQFNKSTATEVEVIEPARQHFTGREAHEWVESVLDETTDLPLFHALKVLQGVEVSDSAFRSSQSLTNALDLAAGASGAGGGDAMINAVHAEYLRFYTDKSGAETKELKQARSRVDKARAALQAANEAFAQVEADVRAHEECVDQIRQLRKRKDDADAVLAASLQRTQHLAKLREDVTNAKADLANAKLIAAQLVEKREQRDALVASMAAARKELAEFREHLDVAEHAVADVTKRSAHADAAATAADERLVAAQRTVMQCRQAQVLVQQRTRLAALTQNLSRIEETTAEYNAVRAQISEITVNARDVAALDALARDVDLATARRDSAATSVTIKRIGDGSITVDGNTIGGDMGPGGDSFSGEGHALLVTSRTAVTVGGIAHIVIDAGDGVAKHSDAVDDAHAKLSAALDALGYASIESAKAALAELTALQAQRDVLSARIDALVPGGSLRAMRAEAATLAEDIGDSSDYLDVTEADVADALSAADAAQRAAQQAAHSAASMRRSTDQERAATINKRDALRAQVDRLLSQIEQAGKTLEIARAEVSDADLKGRSQDAIDALNAAAKAEQYSRDALERENPDVVEAAVREAKDAVDDLDQQMALTQQRLSALALALERSDGAGGMTVVHAAADDVELAERAFESTYRKARAARHLYLTLTSHRDRAHQKYMDPFRRRVEELGRIVFGDDFSVEIGADLAIASRTVGGVTVAYPDLSGGTKEQLSIISRLACATLVDPADGVPVIIDDALGYADPDRAAAMGRVLEAAAGHAQVIVLTCTPSRYRSIASVQTIELADCLGNARLSHDERVATS